MQENIQNKSATRPLRRHASLKPLSRDHHHALLLCWKIRSGLKKKTEIKRISAYALYFFNEHLLPHFDAEENYLFPLAGKQHPQVKQALSEHEQLKLLFTGEMNTGEKLSEVAQTLEAHIRFEERILFNEIEKCADPEQLAAVEAFHAQAQDESWPDPFWKYASATHDER